VDCGTVVFKQLGFGVGVKVFKEFKMYLSQSRPKKAIYINLSLILQILRVTLSQNPAI
jgi:hypothetical protein